jgi:hypothetical protein
MKRRGFLNLILASPVLVAGAVATKVVAGGKDTLGLYSQTITIDTSLEAGRKRLAEVMAQELRKAASRSSFFDNFIEAKTPPCRDTTRGPIVVLGRSGEAVS